MMDRCKLCHNGMGIVLLLKFSVFSLLWRSDTKDVARTDTKIGAGAGKRLDIQEPFRVKNPDQ